MHMRSGEGEAVYQHILSKVAYRRFKRRAPYSHRKWYFKYHHRWSHDAVRLSGCQAPTVDSPRVLRSQQAMSDMVNGID
jgi:hypothetical protein